MKVTREEGSFRPVTIKLETDKEVTDARKAFQLFTEQYNYDWKGRDEMVGTVGLLKGLENE